MPRKSADVATCSDLTLQLRAERKTRERAAAAAKRKLERQMAQAKLSRDHQPFLDEAEILSRREIADAAFQATAPPPKLNTEALVAELIAGDQSRADRLAAQGRETEASLHGEPVPGMYSDIGPPLPAAPQGEAAILIAPAAEVSIWDNAFDDIVQPRIVIPQHLALRPAVPAVPAVPVTLSPIAPTFAYQTDDPDQLGSSDSEYEDDSEVDQLTSSTSAKYLQQQ